MRKSLSVLTFILLFVTSINAQQLTQTLRGIVIDADTKQPIIGATVIVLGSNPLIGDNTSETGAFRFKNLGVGRVVIQVSFIGYQTATLPNVIVDSGKETILNISLQESVTQINEVVVKAEKLPGEVVNDMTLVSGRSISNEETKRYAGGFNDPSLILSNFAGVANSQNGNNDIIVRGNSPKYLQYRLEGTEITNPNHFADQNAIAGGVSALNNNLLATSDFYTGAFSPEYGDVLSGVYDVKLREGNNEKTEAIVGTGILGTDLTLEGPFKKGYAGSFLANYRYSTISLLNKVGVLNVGGGLSFQDGTFKVVFPTKKFGKVSVFALTGQSSASVEDLKPGVLPTESNTTQVEGIRQDFDKTDYLANTGLNHAISIGKRSTVNTTFSYSREGIDNDSYKVKFVKLYDNAEKFIRDSVTSKQPDMSSRLRRSTYRAAITFNHKWNAKNKIQVGSKFVRFGFDYNETALLSDDTHFTRMDFNHNINTWRNFISWKHRANKYLTLVAGVHNMNVLYNHKSTVEPRLGLTLSLNEKNTLSLGYGKHSTMESVHNYFARVEKNGNIIEPNKNLGLLKADHYVIGYEKRLSERVRVKVEAYYQRLYNLPVENADTSYYATINEGSSIRYVELVNRGTGKNYGIEFTLERFFSNNYYYMLNGSLYNSKYKSLDAVERNTAFNNNYIINILAGKEFTNLGRKHNRIIAVNGKFFCSGGKRYIPLLRDASGNVAVSPSDNKFWDYSRAYAPQFNTLYSFTLSFSYKINKPKATHEIFLNLDNITGHKGKLSEYYDENQPGSIGYTTQFGLFPNLLYRIYF
jgi:hypothetical protein